MQTPEELSRPVLLQAAKEGKLQYLAEKTAKNLTEVIKDQCPALSDEYCEKVVKESVFKIFGEFGEIQL